VRAEYKAAHLRKTFASYGDKFEAVVVEDITKEGAFDEAVQGVDAIAHTASPFHLKADEPDEVIIPTVHGTTSVLQSALKHGAGVKRIVITGSTASVLTPSTEPRTFSEENWNEASVTETRALGRAAPAISKYRASKVLAERAAWDFHEKHKSEVGWDLVVLNPPYVFGPPLHEADAADSLNESLHDWYHTVCKSSKSNKTLSTAGSAWIDVRQIAEAHVLATQKEAAGGERIIISAGPFIWQEWVNAARTADSNVPAGDEAYVKGSVPYPIIYLTDKSDRILGIKWLSMEESARDALAEFKARGWWGN